MVVSIRKLRITFIILLIGIDLVWFFASIVEFDITLFKKSNYTIPIILHILLLILLARKSEGNRLITLVIIITLSFFLLIKHSFTPIFHPFSFEHVTIPANKGSVIVESRPDLVYSSVKYYRVYQTKIAGLFLTELTTKEVIIDISKGEFFDINSSELTKDTVTFDTLKGKRTFSLK